MRSRYEIYEKERGRVLTTIPRLLHQLELQSISYIVRMNHFNVNELSTGTDLESTTRMEESKKEAVL